MTSIVQLWLPIVASGIAVFIASSILHMLLKFWHMPDYRGFSNEDEVRAAIRKDNPAPGMYVVPYCRMEDMKTPEAREKYESGPVGLMLLRANGRPGMGTNLLFWLLLCLVVSLFCALVASATLPPGAAGDRVFHVTALVAFVAYATGPFTLGIWWGQPWRTVIKDAVDALIFAVVVGAVFMPLWPHA